MVTLRSYQCNFCREEYSDKSVFRDLSDIIGLKWETKSGPQDKDGKAPTFEILKEVNKENAENHLCKKCIEAIKGFRPHYMTNEDRKNLIKRSKDFLEILGYEVKKKEN